MKTKQGENFLANIWTPIAFLLMLVINILANTLPLNGVTTAEISRRYENLFAPAPITFAIWALIYLLLAAFTVYQLGIFQKASERVEFLNSIRLLFIFSCLANALWIFVWHYDKIPLSMLMTLLMLVCLIWINTLIRKARLIGKEKLLIGVPFSVYFGWLTVATVANATVLLVSLGWDGFGLSESVWTVLILLVAALIGAAVILRNRDAVYGLVLIWAYLGILLRHLSPDGFDGQYPAVLAAVIVGLLLFSVCIVAVVWPGSGLNRRSRAGSGKSR